MLIDPPPEKRKATIGSAMPGAINVFGGLPLYADAEQPYQLLTVELEDARLSSGCGMRRNSQ